MWKKRETKRGEKGKERKKRDEGEIVVGIMRRMLKEKRETSWRKGRKIKRGES